MSTFNFEVSYEDYLFLAGVHLEEKYAKSEEELGLILNSFDDFKRISTQEGLCPLIETANQMDCKVWMSKYRWTETSSSVFMPNFDEEEACLILLNRDQITQVGEKFNTSCWQIALAHEIGHLLAFRQGLDYTSEALAWELAEGVINNPTKEFHSIKEWALS